MPICRRRAARIFCWGLATLGQGPGLRGADAAIWLGRANQNPQSFLREKSAVGLLATSHGLKLLIFIFVLPADGTCSMLTHWNSLFAVYVRATLVRPLRCDAPPKFYVNTAPAPDPVSFIPTRNRALLQTMMFPGGAKSSPREITCIDYSLSEALINRH